MTDVKQHTIARFNEKHDLSVDSQFRQLVEEMGELAEAVNREDVGELAEELADVVFVARSIAELEDINLTKQVNAVAEENLEKDESTDGAKVTKDGLDEERGDHAIVTAEDIRSWPSHDGVTYTAYVATEPPLGDVGDNVAYDTVERENTTVSFDSPEAGGGHIWVSAPGEATTVHESLDADEDPFEVAAEIISNEDIGVDQSDSLFDDRTGITVDEDDPAVEERLRQLKRDIDDEQVNVKLQRALELLDRDQPTYGVTDD